MEENRDLPDELANLYAPWRWSGYSKFIVAVAFILMSVWLWVVLLNMQIGRF